MLRKREFIEIHSSAIEFSYYRKWNRKSQQHFIWWWFHGGGINLITQSIWIGIWSDADEINVPNAESTKSEMLCANDWEIESGLSVFYIYVYIWGGCVIHCIKWLLELFRAILFTFLLSLEVFLRVDINVFEYMCMNINCGGLSENKNIFIHPIDSH